MLNPLELGHQAKDIAENPYLGDLVASESEHCGASILNSSSRRGDIKKLALMRSAVRETSERFVSLGDHFFDFIGKIRESSLDQVNVFSELGMSIFVLSQ
jgi:hypothetical protein